MDPKLSTLDPKLREAYQRVMSGPTSAPGVSTPPTPSIPVSQGPAGQTPNSNAGTEPHLLQGNPPSSFAPAPTAPPPPLNLDTMPTPTQAPPPPAPIPAVTAQPAASQNPSGFNNSSVTFNASQNLANASQSIAVKKKSINFFSIFIVLGLMVLLVAYTYIWMWVFKLKIPFLPQF